MQPSQDNLMKPIHSETQSQASQQSRSHPGQSTMHLPQQMQSSNPYIQTTNNPPITASKIYPEQLHQPQDKILHALCPTCNNWLKISEPIQSHEKVHASHIDDGLYLGSLDNSSNIRELRRLNIGAILNCAVQIPNSFQEDLSFSYKKLTLRDTFGQSIRPYFDECIDFISQSLKNGKNVLVHCAVGKSRSATIVIIYLMVTKKATLRQAYQFVKSKRSIILPNPSYIKQLLEIEKEMYGSNSLTPEQVRPVYKRIFNYW